MKQVRMQSSVEKLRWVLLAGGALLVLLLVGILGYSRYQAVKAWQRILKRTGATLTRETNGITWSQSKGGRTVFTLHAARGVQAKDGKYALHDVALTLYRLPGAPPDRIYGSDFEYDQKTGVARALGEVHMDLQAPNALSQTRRAGKPGVSGGPSSAVPERAQPAEGDGESEEPESIHVRTSGLVYVRNLDVAATDQEVEFRYGGLDGHARGAEFNSGQGTLHLLADVQFSGELRGQPVTLLANRADLDRGTNLVTLAKPLLRTEEGMATATSTVLHLRASGLVERVEASGGVRLVRGTQTMTAARLEAQLRDASVLEAAHLSGGVVLTDTDPGRPATAQAAEVQASFDAHGSPASVVATGTVQLKAVDQDPGRPPLSRFLTAAHLQATFSAPADRKGKPELQRLDALGGAHAWAESLGPQRTPPPAQNAVSLQKAAPLRNAAAQQKAVPSQKERTEIAGDQLHVSFVPAGVSRTARGTTGTVTPERIEGQGHTLLLQSLPQGVERRSTGDRLVMTLAGKNDEPAAASRTHAAVEVASAMQEGHVTLRSEKPGEKASGKPSEKPGENPSEKPGVVRPGANAKPEVTTASADRVEFRADPHQLTLHGGVHLVSSTTELAAADVVLDTESGNAEARGGVRGTMLRSAAEAKSAVVEETHVAAASAHFGNDSGVASFFGTDAQPAHLWQGGSQVMAAMIVLDRERNTLAARPAASGALVRCVFAGARSRPAALARPAEQSAAKSASTGAPWVMRLSSPRLDYNGTAHEAAFTGGIHLEGDLGEARSTNAVVFLSAAADASGKAGANTSADNLAMAGTNAAASARPVPPSAARLAGSATGSSPAALSTPTLGGSVDKVVLSGKVQMEQPGRVGTGEQLLYTAATGSFVLTGAPGRPPHVVDKAQGSLTGTTLLFRAGDNTVVVAGGPSDASQAGQARTRVHTELNVRGQ